MARIQQSLVFEASYEESVAVLRRGRCATRACVKAFEYLQQGVVGKRSVVALPLPSRGSSVMERVSSALRQRRP